MHVNHILDKLIDLDQNANEAPGKWKREIVRDEISALGIRHKVSVKEKDIVQVCV